MVFFRDIDEKSVGRVGGKALGLVKLSSYGFRVPDFFVIPSDANLGAPSFRRELNEAAKRIGADRFAVRSSGTEEDGERKSFAGQYATELNVPAERLYEAVLKVVASSDSATVREYSRGSGTDAVKKIAVIVQKQILPIKAGVMFTGSPFARDEIVVEEVDGSGEALVSGAVTPVCKTFPKSGDCTVSGFERDLLNAAILLEKAEGKPMDVEWAYDGTLYFLQMRPVTTAGDRLPDIGKKKWNLYVHRDFCRLCHSVQARATDGDLQEKRFGFRMPVFEGILLNGREFYTDRNDRLANRLWAEYDGDGFFGSFADEIEKSVKKTRRRANELRRKDYSGATDDALFSAYDREMNGYIESYLPLMMRPDEYLYLKLCKQIGNGRADAFRAILPALAGKTLYSEEKKRFLRALRDGKPENYIDAYEWSNNPLSASNAPRGNAEYEERARGLTSTQAQKELRTIAARERRAAEEARTAIGGIASETVKQTLSDIVRFIHLRTYTTENSDRYFFYIRERILREIARRSNLSLKEVMGMDYREVSALRTGTPTDKTELQRRNRGELIVFWEKGTKTYYGSETYLLLQKILPSETPITGSVFRGQIACNGEATGTVRIVRSGADVKKMNDGDILVTSMTTPEISLAIDKASGIITDEGGITCHAAIVAREWGVPCLIGTQRATSVLRDGMTVKLNCIRGYFEIRRTLTAEQQTTVRQKKENSV